MKQRSLAWLIWAAVFHFCFMLIHVPSPGQPNIPVGTWRLHLSHNNIRAVEVTAEFIYAASASGIVVFNRTEKSLSAYHKLNGLSNTGLSSLAYDNTRGQLLVGYDDGNLDIIRGGTVSNFSRLSEADVTTSRKINHISVSGNFAYLSTDYGVILFDLSVLEIHESWRDLGTGGQQLPIFESAFLNDSVYLATASGVLAGKTSDNLLDYNNWERSDGANLAGPVNSIATFNNKIYAAGPTGVYRLGSDTWVQEPFLASSVVESLSASGQNLIVVADSAVWLMNAGGQVSEVSETRIQAPAVAKQDETGHLWVGDQREGLLSDASGAFTSYVPNGPSLLVAKRLVYDKGKVYALAGHSQTGNIPGDLNVFENGSWSTFPQPVDNLTDIAFLPSATFISSFGSGLLVIDGSGNTSVLDHTNSPLTSTDPGRSMVSALVPHAGNLWVANYGGTTPLHLLKSDGGWESFSFNFPNAQKPVDLAVDGGGNVWMALDPLTGGGLIAVDGATRQGFLKTTAAGEGALPHKNVNCITVDRDGYAWLGTDAGVAWFFSPADDAVKPIYDNRFLLRDERITAIETDPGNRKWMGTEAGVWLFSPKGEELIYHFTRENSPLLSNRIIDIAVNEETGEVFFATDQGIVSYRGDAITATADTEAVKIFPNPVSPGYAGTVAISGLSNDASVRITDISGNLVWQTQSHGGMATWHVRDHRGRRATTGVYLVFATSEDGRDSVVGKIAVIE